MSTLIGLEKEKKEEQAQPTSSKHVKTVLELQNLSMTYVHHKKQEKALTNIQLSIKQGEFVGVLGRSGAGKSTLIRCINQLVKPTEGKVIWNGQDVTGQKGKALRYVRTEIGMIFQQFNLIPRLTVLQNCLIGRFAYRSYWRNVLGMINAEEKSKAMEALARVGLDHLAGKRVDHLSGGQQQRVAIARVIMQQPKLLLGDEPVASLDPVTSKQVMELIKEIHHTEGMTSLINLHDVQLAMSYCDRIIGLAKGELVFDGHPSEVNDQILERIYS